MERKRYVHSVLALTLTAALMAGCSAGGSGKEGAVRDEGGSAAVSSGPVNLRLLSYDHTLDEVLKVYEEKNPGVKVQVDIQTENNSTEFLKKLDLMQLAGDTYDLTCMPSYGQYALRAEKGFWEPLDGYFEKAGVQPGEYYTIDTKVGDAYYGIPGTPGIYYVIINKTMLDEAGLEVPALDWTWEDYAEYAAAMTKGEGANKVYGSYMHTWTEYRRENMWCVRDQNCYINEDGTSNLSDPNFGEWLQFIKGMEDDGIQVPYGDAKATNMAYRDVFFNGKAAMVLTGSWMVNDIKNIENFPHDFVTAFAAFPRWKDSAPGRCEGDSGIYVVNSNSENKEQAYGLIFWLADAEATDVTLNPSSVRGADNTAILKKTVEGQENLFDMDSMIRIWNDPNLTPVGTRSHLTAFSEVDEIYNAETEKYMVGGQDLETTLKNIREKGDAVISKMAD